MTECEICRTPHGVNTPVCTGHWIVTPAHLRRGFREAERRYGPQSPEAEVARRQIVNHHLTDEAKP